MSGLSSRLSLLAMVSDCWCKHLEDYVCFGSHGVVPARQERHFREGKSLCIETGYSGSCSGVLSDRLAIGWWTPDLLEDVCSDALQFPPGVRQGSLLGIKLWLVAC